MYTHFLLSLFVLFSSLIFFSGCTNNTQGGLQSNFPQSVHIPLSSIVELGVINTIPCDNNCSYTRKGFGIMYDPETIRTVEHLIPDDLSTFKIVNQNGKECIIQNLRTHPTQDLVLIKTSAPCGIKNQKIQVKELLKSMQEPVSILFNNKKIPAGLPALHSGLYVVSGFNGEEGMSGSPLINEQGAVLGILSAQYEKQGIFVPLMKYGNELLTLSQEPSNLYIHK